jgi:hypothetical protein
MVAFEQAMMQVLILTVVEALVFSAFLVAVFYMSKVILGHLLWSLRAEGASAVLVSAHRDTVLDLGENTGDGRPASKPRNLTEAETEQAIN